MLYSEFWQLLFVSLLGERAWRALVLTETDYFTFRTEAKNGGGTLPVFCVALDNKTETHKINQEVKRAGSPIMTHSQL